MAVASTDILGQYEASLKAATGGSDRIATDKNTFLKLLIAQLTNQDPLNPAEDKEFIAQLAQFTSVEELQKINTGIEGLQSAQNQQQVINAATLMGTEISAKGDLITKRSATEDGKTTTSISPIFAVFPKAAASCTVNIYSTNADGSIGKLIRSSEVEAQTAGRHEFRWDGKDNNGKELAAGTYVMTFAAKDADGKSMLVETSSVGTVVGVQTSTDGNHHLYLNDGRTVRFNNVEFITYPIDTTKKDPEPEPEKDPEPEK